ncbi:MAG: transcription antitermination factor NusB [Desulfobacterales bacterium]|nr:transcription antitermination factor NusB [Desulfobacterales bacterium]
MGSRRRARELALQALFYADMNRSDIEKVLESFCSQFTPSKRALPYFTRLVRGVSQTRTEIDSFIENFADHWKISRISCVDRNIMRIGVYELLYCSDIPSKVAINEAIDIGKKFGAEESGAFINGILDGIRIALSKGEIRIKDIDNKV